MTERLITHQYIDSIGRLVACTKLQPPPPHVASARPTYCHATAGTWRHSIQRKPATYSAMSWSRSSDA